MIEMLCKTENEVLEIKKRFSDCNVLQKCKFKVLGSYAVYVEIPKDLNNVCEWKESSDGLYLHSTSCGEMDSYDSSYKYCPYCSKKIVLVNKDNLKEQEEA